ncbi:acetylxylan esterase [Alistipes senegalensis]|uniref:acetylxylan esterase n=2 Tax=Alistipes senegalensis TaxID=1288121 RepID=UPI001898125F|nr:acetylxylan esterase [Alistipes senegalensis]
MKRLLLVIGLSLSLHAASALPKGKISIEITPDRTEDWRYSAGDSVAYDIVVRVDGKPLKNASVKYTFAREKMPAHETHRATLPDGRLRVKTAGMPCPGFLTCRVFLLDEKGATVADDLAQAAFDPEKLRPMTDMPEDFAAFWERAKAENAKIPMDPRVERAEQWCTDKVDVYYVRLQSFRKDNYVYGYVSVPKSKGPHPAVLYVPGAGVAKTKPSTYMAEKGVITMTLGIHGIPLDMPDENYDILKNGALYNYQFVNLDNRDQYYYKRVFMGCIRAIDYLFTRPEFDGERLMVSGGSQGGGLSIVTTALDPRVKYFVCFYPALCDHMGYLYDRAGGWPHMFDRTRAYFRTAERILNSRYYDAANFARLIRVPGFFSWGYNDLSCPITSMYSAYNVVTAPKELVLELRNGHRRSERQNRLADAWMLRQFFGEK